MTLFQWFRSIAPSLGLILGAILSYVLALILEIEMVSWAFLIGYPLILGLVIMRFRPKGTFGRFWKAVGWLLVVMLLSIFGTFALGLEGLICVAMAMVPMLAATLLGGVIYLAVVRWRQEAAGGLQVTLLPLLAAAGLALPDTPPRSYEFVSEIVIQASPQMVFAALKSIPDIAPEEIATRPSHLLGVPKPTAAVWQDTPEGPELALRHSYWGADVHFLERITEIEPDRRIAWDFDFPQGWASEGIEDRHVTVGGPYFDVLSGGYDLTPVEGGTHLRLTTRTYDASGLGSYAWFWHRFFITDFNEVILLLVKARIEASQST